MQIEEYSTRVEQVGGIGNSNYQYVVDMVIKPLWTRHNRQTIEWLQRLVAHSCTVDWQKISA